MASGLQGEPKRQLSIFEVPGEYFELCRVLPSPTSSVPLPLPLPLPLSLLESNEEENKAENEFDMKRWSCNICKAEFDSLFDQRSHFKSDFHRFNVKLSVAGKDTLTEEDFSETLSESLCKDYDVSSISGSDDEYDRDNVKGVHRGSVRNVKSKLFLQLQNGERVWVWRSLLLGDSESVSFDNDKSTDNYDGGNILRETEVTKRLNNLIHESRDSSKLRVVLLLRGGHFAGCVFEGNTVVAHKTFHRYVVRAKAGKKQSSKDAGGRSIHSAGAALRRYNEFALKKDIEELFTAWKPYFSSSSSIFIYAPSSNRQLFFDGENPYFVCQHHAIRNIPLTVRRPTYKEARRIYNILTQVSYDIEEESTTTSKVVSQNISLESDESLQSTRIVMKEDTDGKVSVKHVSGDEKLQTEDVHASSESGSDRDQSGVSTALHEAAKSGDAQKILELLEQDLDPCALDERGRTPYMLATEKEVRNTFRRFMASNLEKWDWHAAKVPSPLTKEMEESQAAKQAEKDAKKKARAKELKKIRKAKEKKAQAEAAQAQTTSNKHGASSQVKGQSQSSGWLKISNEEERKKTQETEREMRAAAAERRIAAMAALKEQDNTKASQAPSSSQPTSKTTSDGLCSCCYSSLAGKVPFHRYNYNYCSSTCMHMHKDILEDG